MSTATRRDTQSPALHVAESHDLIRVHGGRENNLKNVSVEIPKRRLTVFTGVSGSGKSSLVLVTIAAAVRSVPVRVVEHTKCVGRDLAQVSRQIVRRHRFLFFNSPEFSRRAERRSHR